MKTRIVLICLLFLSGIQVSAQEKLAGGFSHVIDVKNFPNYGKDYLTIANAHYYKIGEEKKRVNISYDYTDPLNMEGEVWPLSLIVAVDGVSAKGWSSERFYSVVDGRKDSIKLRLRTHKDGEIVEFDTEITPRYELPDYLKIYGEALSDNYYTKMSDEEYVGYRARQAIAQFEVRFDPDYDFFDICYYDYYITGDDPLLDKEILGRVGYLDAARLPKDAKDSKPDVLITAAKDVNQQIEAVYVPPTSRTVQTGSNSTSYYDKVLGRNVSQTSITNKTIRENGFTKEINKTDLFLEIAALDYSKINDSSITYTPVIWKATAKRHITDGFLSEPNQELVTYASWMELGPFDKKLRYVSKKTLYPPLGVYPSPFDNKIIGPIVPYSRAEALGLQVGDKLVGITFSTTYSKKEKLNKNVLSKDGWTFFNDKEYFKWSFDIVYERNGKKHTVSFDGSVEPLLITTYFIHL